MKGELPLNTLTSEVSGKKPCKNIVIVAVDKTQRYNRCNKQFVGLNARHEDCLFPVFMQRESLVTQRCGGLAFVPFDTGVEKYIAVSRYYLHYYHIM